jgi:hypothetical protein
LAANGYCGEHNANNIRIDSGELFTYIVGLASLSIVEEVVTNAGTNRCVMSHGVPRRRKLMQGGDSDSSKGGAADAV